MLKSIVRFLLKFCLYSMLVIVALFLTAYLIFDQPLPDGIKGEKAEQLAQKMLRRTNQKAWDNTHYVEWSFMGMHHFLWDKKRHLVRVEWSDYKVLLNPNKMEGVVYCNGQKIEEDKYALLQTAYSNFTNDAFWLNAFTQIYNGDTEISYVELEDDQEGLLVTYLSGGVTPGDSYLWILDDSGLPVAWKMWVGILPIGGIRVSWEDWTSTYNGAMYAESHKAGPFNVSISNFKSYPNWKKGGLDTDPFSEIR